MVQQSAPHSARPSASASFELRAHLATGILGAVHVEVKIAGLVARVLAFPPLRAFGRGERVIASLGEGNDDWSVGACRTFVNVRGGRGQCQSP